MHSKCRLCSHGSCKAPQASESRRSSRARHLGSDGEQRDGARLCASWEDVHQSQGKLVESNGFKRLLSALECNGNHHDKRAQTCARK